MNPSAREVLETEQGECTLCKGVALVMIQNGGEPFPCKIHRAVLHGIELAERADLERVVSREMLIPIMRELYQDTLEGLPQESLDWQCGFDAGMDKLSTKLLELRAAFPEVKDGE